MAVIKLEPIAAKARASVSLHDLLPPGNLARLREQLDNGAEPGDPPISEHAADFLAHHMLICQAGYTLLALPAFAALDRQHQQLEEEFLSGGPPMSPIYDSYSGMHMLAEIPIGIGSETPMTVLARLTAGRPEYSHVHNLASQAASSHLDLYRATEVRGDEAKIVHLRSKTELAVHLTGPFLRDRDLFLGRVFRFHTGQHFIAESPYLLITAERAWFEYFERVMGAERVATNQKAKDVRKKAVAAPDHREQRLVRHLRLGENYRFWPEFIFNAYAGERNGIVALTGIPDRPETQPHHESFDERTFEPDEKPVATEIPPLERVRRKLSALAAAQGIARDYAESMRLLAGKEVALKGTPYEYLFRAFCCFGAQTERGTTLLEEQMQTGGVNPSELAVMRAIARGWFSLFEIRRVHLDQSLEVTDLLSRKRLTITEQSATRCVGIGDALAGWIMVEEDGTVRLEGGVVHLKPLLREGVLEQLTRVRKVFREEGVDMSEPRNQALLVPHVILIAQTLTEGFPAPPSEPTVSLPAGVNAALASELMKRLRGALDEPIPMFRQRTLRQLARSPKSRPDAIAWLREQERILRASPRPIAVSLRPLWTELGLEYQGLDTDPG